MPWSYANIDWEQTLTAAVGVATVVQAGVAILMMKGLKHSAASVATATETLAEMRASSRRQLRAYITAEASEILPDAANADGMPIRIVFLNSGQTPAHDVRVIVRSVIMPAAQFEVWEPPPAPALAASAVLAAQGKTTFIDRLPLVSWVQAEPDIRARATTLGFVCEVTYRDIFGSPHRLNIRRQLRVELHPTNLSATIVPDEAD